MKTVLNVKTDKDVKEKAQAIAKEMGVPLSIIVNSYLKFFIKTRTLVISLDPKVNDEISKQVHKQLMILRKNKV